MEKELQHKFVAVHTPLITSLKGPGEKMSKSISGSGVSVLDSYDEIKKTIKNAYCPEKIKEENPILQIARLIIFPRFDSIKISRPEKFGGDLNIESYSELEKLYLAGKLHPMDLKNCVADYLEKIIEPIRKSWK
jgi:tyrosyl-tRNA synthetase